MNRTLDYFLKSVDVINEYVGRWVSYLGAVMTGIMMFEVVARYVFQSPTIWAMEVNQALLCAYTALAGGHILLYGSHVNVEIVYGLMSVRKRALTDLVTSVFSFAFIGTLVWTSYESAMEAWEYWEVSLSLFAMPQFPVRVVIPIGSALLFLQLTAKFIRDVRILVTGIEPEAKAGIFSNGEA